jgi:hypothetical protein
VGTVIVELKHMVYFGLSSLPSFLALVVHSRALSDWVKRAEVAVLFRALRCSEKPTER